MVADCFSFETSTSVTLGNINKLLFTFASQLLQVMPVTL
jgi:hypothetical protein